MPEAIQFEAVPRETLGTGAAREVRRQGRVPAVIYGAGTEPQHISLPLKELTFRSGKRNFKSTVFEINLGGKKIRTVAKDITFNVVSDIPEHVDLQIVSSKTAVKVFVPVNYLNQAKAPGLKRGGVLNIVRRDIEFFVSPDNIPEKIDVDLTGLDIGSSIHVEDLKFPEGVRPVMRRNFTIVTIVGKGAEEAVATTAPAAGEVPATNVAAPAAGAAAPAAAGGKAAAPAAKAAAPAAAAAKPAAKK